MQFFPIFLSVVFVLRNQSRSIKDLLARTTEILSKKVSDYELIIIDNASIDDSIFTFERLTAENGLANIQAFALANEVDIDTAAWVGLENALGDFIAVIDPMVDEIDFLPSMIEQAVLGSDMVFANNHQKPKQSFFYRGACSIFNHIYKKFNGVHLGNDSPQYRLLSRRIVNFILQHPQPAVTYRHLPATGGFTRSNLLYSAKPKVEYPKKFQESIERGMRLLVSTTRAPMRLVTSLSLFGAIANLIYSLYVVAIGLLKTDVAPGWVSLSLQQSGMFFLISLVLLVLGEYILNMASLSNEGPPYYIAQEFTSCHITRQQKLNIEEAHTPSSHLTSDSPRRTI